jgi:hypothetical protein
MYPQSHFLVPFFLGLVLKKFNLMSLEGAIISGIIGVLIDLDHYIYYALKVKKNRFSLRNAWNNSSTYHGFSARTFIHYWPGMIIISIIILILLLYNWKFALILGLAYYSHIILDHKMLNLDHLKTLRFKIFRLIIRLQPFELILDILCLIGIIILLF